MWAKSAWTTDANQVAKTVFNPGDSIDYFGAVYNNTGAAQTVHLDWSATGPCGSILAYSYDGSTSPGELWWYMPYYPIPTDACGGVYTYTFSVTYNSQTTYQSTTFTVNSDITPTATPSGPTATPTATATRTPANSVWAKSAWTTDGNRIDKTDFNPGDAIDYFGSVYNSTGITQTVQLDWNVTGPCGLLLDRSYDGATAPGELRWYWPYDPIPVNACGGVYTFTFGVTYNGQTTYQSTTFTVNSSITPTATPSGPTPTQTATATGTPANSVWAKSAWTTDANQVAKTLFAPGDRIDYFGSVYNNTGITQTVRLDWSVDGPCGSILARNYTGPTATGEDWWYWPYDPIPVNACGGVYTYTFGVTFNSAVTSQSVTFTVSSGITPTATPTVTPSLTLTPTPTATPSGMNNTVIDYTYDPLYRLTGATYTGAYTETFGYSYDAVGNRLTQTANGVVTNYAYDEANRLTSVNGQAYTWDANGNLTNDGLLTYAYDQANRLKTVTQGANTYTFSYDGLGDRLSQTVGSTQTRYALDPGAGLTQVLSDGTNAYLYGAGALRVAQYQTDMQYFGADALGSVRQMYDSSGQVIADARYDPYGGESSQSGAATTAYGFAGELADASGLQYLRTRYYAPTQGRFVARDEWEGDDQRPLTLNRWNYLQANPVNFTDPSGRQGPAADAAALCLSNPAICAEVGAALVDAGGVTLVVGGGTTVVVGTTAGAYFGTCWAMQDFGPDYPMPATFEPGTIQPTYPLAQSGTLTIPSRSIVYAKTGSEIFAHLAMLLGGIPVGGVPPHPGKPDPSGRDRVKNLMGLITALSQEVKNMARVWGESAQPNLEKWLTENNWNPTDVRNGLQSLRDYADYVLPTDVANYGVDQGLANQVTGLLSEMGVTPK